MVLSPLYTESHSSAMEAQLVARVKEIQKSDPDGKQGWWNYADTQGDGVRDPAKHPAAFLEWFLAEYSQGKYTGVASTTDAGALAELFKEGQRNSGSFKSAWAMYQSMNGNSKNDPTKAGKQALVDFLDMISQSGMQTMMGNGSMSGKSSNRMGKGFMGAKSSGWSGNDSNWGGSGGDVQTMMNMMMMMSGKGSGGWGGDAKRQKTSSSASTDPIKGKLIEKIKSFQRSGEVQKQTWWSYCDAQPDQKRDPAFYDAEFLQTFTILNGI